MKVDSRGAPSAKSCNVHKTMFLKVSESGTYPGFLRIIDLVGCLIGPVLWKFQKEELDAMRPCLAVNRPGAPHLSEISVAITMFLVRLRVWQWHSKLPLIWLIILGAPRPLGMDFGMVYEGFSVFVMKTTSNVHNYHEIWISDHMLPAPRWLYWDLQGVNSIWSETFIW